MQEKEEHRTVPAGECSDQLAMPLERFWARVSRPALAGQSFVLVIALEALAAVQSAQGARGTRLCSSADPREFQPRP